jgi:hypothetical protein
MIWFVSKNTHAREVLYLQQQLNDMMVRFYHLHDRHNRLLEHLGLYEQKFEGVVLRQKGGAEQPELVRNHAVPTTP